MRQLAVSIMFLGVAVGSAGCGGPDDDGAGPVDGPLGDAARPDAGGGGPDAAPDCTFTPTGQFNPVVECRWDGPSTAQPYPARDDVVMTPVVINLTDDDADGDVDLADVPDIAFVSYDLQGAGCCNVDGVLRVVSGACGPDGVLPEHFSVGASEIEADTGLPGLWLDNSGGLAVGDIDDDGEPEIVAMLNGGGTIAFDRTGAVEWVQRDHPAGADRLAGVQPAIANLDGVGSPEVIVGRVVLDGASGALRWQGTAGLGTNGFLGPVSTLGDLDLAGGLNLLAGATMYEPLGTPAWTYAYPTPIDAGNCQAQGYPCDGFTATGSFDADDEGELVIVRAGRVYVLEHDGTPMPVGSASAEIVLPVDDCALNEGGPPTVADFDGDGEPEIGVAAADYYVVVDLECLATPLPAQCSDVGIRWKVGNADCSSRVTGSSVFDFDADGRAEVVYADELEFRILDGRDGSERLAIPNTSHTRLEMPIVVDADNDGNAEIVFVENAHNGTTQGVRVYGDATDSWASTRRIWNQHGYHVTNVGELGQIPLSESPNWLTPNPNTASGRMNNFRQNLPEYDADAAPDLVVSLSLSPLGCALSARVCNEGDVVAGAGVPVRFWDNATQQEIPCDGGPLATTAPLPPGACADVRCVWTAAPDPVDVRACVDNPGYACGPSGGGNGANNECAEGNNLDARAGAFACQPIE